MRRLTTLSLVMGLAASAIAQSDDLFVPTGQEFGVGDATLVVALADLDGDGDLDALTPTYVGPALRWVNDGSGAFSGETPLGEIAGTTIEVDDYNGDGHADVFLCSIAGRFTQVFLNDGNGGFESTAEYLLAIGTGSDTGDVDGDGDLDVFVGSAGGYTNSVFFNEGAGSFTLVGGLHGTVGRGVALGDLDGDGDLDAYLAIGGSGGALPDAVQLNDGSGNFTDSGQSLGHQFGDHVALADFDGDGDLDAFVANDDLFDSDPTDRLWLNDGAGNFTDSGQRLGSSRSTHVAAGDLDRDGDIDAVVAHPFAPDSVWLNDGSGSFVLVQLLGGVEQNMQLGLGDLDGDGLLDVFSNGGGAGERVYVNTLCPGDLNADGQVNTLDFLDFLTLWADDDGRADWNQDGTIDVLDFLAFLGDWARGC